MIHFTDDSTVDELMATDHVYEVAIKFGNYCAVGETSASMDVLFGGGFTSEWLFEDQIISLQTRDPIYDSNPCIGAVPAKRLTTKVFVGQYIPDGYITGTRRVWVATRIYKSSEPTTKTSWHIVGPWIEERREYDPQTGVLTVTATDALSRADTPYMKIEPTTAEYMDGNGRYCYKDGSTSYPLLSVVLDICAILRLEGMETEAYNMLSDLQLDLPVPDDTVTMRDILRWAAGMCGANARISWISPVDYPLSLGALDFVKFNVDHDLIQLGSACASVKVGDVSNTSDYWDVCLTGGEQDYTSTHDAQDRVTARFQMENPLGSVAHCDRILASIRETGGEVDVWEYRGLTAQNAMLDIRAEAGDLVQVEIPRYDGLYDVNVYIIGEIVRTYDHLCTATINVPNMTRREIDPYIPEVWQ